jgi:hypothetical protein
MEKRRNIEGISCLKRGRYPSSSLLWRESFGIGRDIFYRWNGWRKKGKKLKPLKHVLS